MPRSKKEENTWTTIRVSRGLHDRIQAIGRSLDSKMMEETVEAMYRCYTEHNEVQD